MKIFLLFTIVIFAAYLLGFIKKNDTGEWMSRDFTTAIKGFSILTVVWAHTGARLSVGGIQFIAGIGVSLFLICSGYGLEISYEKSGLQGFVRKRLFKVCIPFWVVELIGLIAIGKFTVDGYILDALFIRQATSYGWFMQYIIICYIIFFVDKKMMERIAFIREHEMTVIFTVFIAWFAIDSMFFANPDMPFLKARQMLCFPTGMLIVKHKDYCVKFLSEKKKSFVMGVGGCLSLL